MMIRLIRDRRSQAPREKESSVPSSPRKEPSLRLPLLPAPSGCLVVLNAVINTADGALSVYQHHSQEQMSVLQVRPFPGSEASLDCCRLSIPGNA